MNSFRIWLHLFLLSSQNRQSSGFQTGVHSSPTCPLASLPGKKKMNKSILNPFPMTAYHFYQKCHLKMTSCSARSTLNASSNTPLDDFLWKEVQLEKPNHWRHGLSDSEVKKRIRIYGRNELPLKKEKELYELFLEQFNDRLVQVLLLVALVSAITSFAEARDNMIQFGQQDGNHIEYFIEPIIILSILVINSTVGVWQQLSARKSLDALKKMQPRLANVLRKDEVTGISEWITGFHSSDLVPGDVIKINVGEFVPADVCLAHTDSNVFAVDESALTGESESVFKTPFHQINQVDGEQHSAMAFSGSIVTAGRAVAIVLRTGCETKLGQIQSSMDAVEDEKTPLTQKLDKFADDLAKIIAIICAGNFSTCQILLYFDGR